MDNFNELIEQHLPKMKIWALSWTRDKDRANDLVQDTAIKLLESHEQFVPDTNFSAWASRIMYNLMVSQWRTNRRRATVDIYTVEIPEAPKQESRLNMLDLKSALLSLTKEQRIPLLMMTIGEMSQEEIAKAYKTPIGTIKSKNSRTRDLLKRFISDDSCQGRGPKAEVLKRKPKCFCRGDAHGFSIMESGKTIVTATAPNIAWQKALEMLNGCS